MQKNTPFFLEKQFLEKIMQDFTPQKDIRIEHIEFFEVDNSASILVALTAQESNSMIGHFGIKVTYSSVGVKKTQKMVLKVKPHSQEIMTMLDNLAQMCGGELAEIYSKYKTETGFRHTHQREQEIYKKIPSLLTPTIFGVYTNEDSNLFMILMEYLEDVTLLNAVMQPQMFTEKHIYHVISQLAQWHYEVQLEKLNLDYWTDTPSKAYMQCLEPLWGALLDHAQKHFPDLYTEKRVDFLKKAIENIPKDWEVLENYPKTLIHNDCNSRNMCFRGLEPCLYDWELATIHAPQYDIVEFLCFTLNQERYHLRTEFIEYYYQKISSLDQRFQDKTLFLEVLRIVALHFGLHRLGMYMMAHTVSSYPFLPFVVNNYFAWFDL
jgi:tRNA A-37 threonylcarbamoyl transferase component Bud32